MTNEQNAPHVEVLHSIIASGDWSESERAAIRAAIAAISSPPAAGDARDNLNGSACDKQGHPQGATPGGTPGYSHATPTPSSPAAPPPDAELIEAAQACVTWYAKRHVAGNHDELLAAEDQDPQMARLMRALAAAPKPAAPPSVTDAMEASLSHLKVIADNAYVDGCHQHRKTECLGREHKLAKGTFGEAEYRAHEIAIKHFARHFAIHEAIKAIRASLAALTHPGHKHAQEDAAQEGARGDRPSDAAISREFWKRWTSTEIHMEAAHELQRMFNDAIDSEAK